MEVVAFLPEPGGTILREPVAKPAIILMAGFFFVQAGLRNGEKDGTEYLSFYF